MLEEEEEEEMHYRFFSSMSVSHCSLTISGGLDTNKLGAHSANLWQAGAAGYGNHVTRLSTDSRIAHFPFLRKFPILRETCTLITKTPQTVFCTLQLPEYIVSHAKFLLRNCTVSCNWYVVFMFRHSLLWGCYYYYHYYYLIAFIFDLIYIITIDLTHWNW